MPEKAAASVPEASVPLPLRHSIGPGEQILKWLSER
jgi:hypothetical protein